jgi:glycosyltransferase involved in cell wall biosynthesis
MRIAFDYQTFVLQSYGGISRYFVRLAQGLTDSEQQVKVFAPLHRNSYLSSLPENIVSERHVSQFPSKTTRLFLAYNHIQSRLKISGWKPDLVHETYYSRFGSAPKNCPVVITVHDMIHELFPNDIPLKDNTSTIKRIAIERCDHIICVSQNTKRDLMRICGVPNNKISVVYHGFDQFSQCDGLEVDAFVESKPFLLYVGQRSGYKNFSGFLKSVATSRKLMKDFNVVAFGGGRFSSDELQFINSLGFSHDQVRQKSGNDKLLGRYYSSASAFVYPSLYEGFGIPPLEAMAHNCPVVSSNTSSMPEVIGDAAEFFNPLETDDIRQSIESVVYSNEQAMLLRRLGSVQVNKFSWSKCASETLNVYKSAL